MDGKLKEKLMKYVFMAASIISIAAFIVICYFIFKTGLPFILRHGFDFILGTKWSPATNPPSYGILPMIYASFVVTFLASLIGVPIGIFSALFLAFEAGPKMKKLLTPMLNLMAGIPSIIYGFFALQTIVPFIREYIGGHGISILAASILLGIMILPTIIAISEAGLEAVNSKYYETSVALGASHGRSVMKIVLPAAKNSILAAVILGIGRAIGETMATILVVGNQARITTDILKGIRTLTANVVLEMGYAAGEHMEALFATACILFIFILIINGMFLMFKGRSSKNEG